MIFDRLDNARWYQNALPDLGRALEFARGLTGDTPLGRIELANGLYCTVMEGQTSPAGQGLFECHRKYLDLQVVLDGQEVVEVADLAALTPQVPYDQGRDAAFLAGEATLSATAQAGWFYLLTPQDGHRACLHTHRPNAYKKAVVKIPIREG